MNLLADTHVAIWALTSPDVLPERIRALLEDTENVVYISPVSIWEISIKYRLGRKDGPPFPGRYALQHLLEAGWRVLNVTDQHACAVDDLPLLHGDPFDRLLVAQALSEPMRLVSADKQLAAYSDTVITW